MKGTQKTTVIVEYEGLYAHYTLTHTTGTAEITSQSYRTLQAAVEALINPEEYVHVIILKSGLILLNNPKKVYDILKKHLKYSSYKIKTNKEEQHATN